MAENSAKDMIQELNLLKTNFLSKVGELEDLKLSKKEKVQTDKIIQQVVIHSEIALDYISS